MLIYVNEFILQSNSATTKALNSICGWLKSKTDEHFTIDMLKSGSDFPCHKSMVRTFCATSSEPFMYSVLFTHPDITQVGRNWETELTVIEENGKTRMSILLQTNDVSTQVRSIPIATRPAVVGFLKRNNLLSSLTIGLNTKTIKNNRDDLVAFRSEIYRSDRTNPLVFISQSNLIIPNKLQAQLIGLAQVVTVSSDMDDGLMEEVLTKRYSCWDGAVNIIYPNNSDGSVSNRLLLSGDIKNWISSSKNIYHELLSLITSSTNSLNRRKHLSPTHVRAKRQKDQRAFLSSKIDEVRESTGSMLPIDKVMLEFDTMTSQHENEKIVLLQEVTDSTNMYYAAQSELEALSNELIIVKAKLETIESRSKNENRDPIYYYGEETDLYQGEISAHITKALKNHLDNSKIHSRKYDVLKDLVTSNNVDQVIDETLNKLNVEFKTFTQMTPKIREAFSILNVEVLNESGHNKAKFIGEPRYTATFAKTPSDTRRAGRNMISAIEEELF